MLMQFALLQLCTVLDSGAALILWGQLSRSQRFHAGAEIHTRSQSQKVHQAQERTERLHSGHELCEMPFYSQSAFSTEKCPLSSAYYTVAKLRGECVCFFSASINTSVQHKESRASAGKPLGRPFLMGPSACTCPLEKSMNLIFGQSVP